MSNFAVQTLQAVLLDAKKDMSCTKDAIADMMEHVEKMRATLAEDEEKIRKLEDAIVACGHHGKDI